MQEEYNKYIYKNIEELNEQKKQLDNYTITLKDFLDSNNVVALIVGSMIGVALTYIVKDFSYDVIGPIMNKFVFKNSTHMEFLGINFNIERIISNIIFVIITFITLYLFVIIFLRDNITTISLQKKNSDINNQKNILNTSLYQEKNIKLLSEIKQSLNQINQNQNL